MAKKGYKHKTIAFRLDDPEDKRLYDELQSKAYGEFSRITKEMWEKRLKEGDTMRYGTYCELHNDHPQQFEMTDLDDKGIYYCDTCNRPLMVLIDGSFHRVEPLAIIEKTV